MVMVGRTRGGEAEAEIGVGRGDIGGIRMTKRGHIRDVDPEIHLITEGRTGRGRGIVIGGNGPGATMGEMMSEPYVDDRSGVTLRICVEGGENPGIEITITEDKRNRL